MTAPKAGPRILHKKCVRDHDVMENNIRNINDVPRCAL